MYHYPLIQLHSNDRKVSSFIKSLKSFWLTPSGCVYANSKFYRGFSTLIGNGFSPRSSIRCIHIQYVFTSNVSYFLERSHTFFSREKEKALLTQYCFPFPLFTISKFLLLAWIRQSPNIDLLANLNFLILKTIFEKDLSTLNAPKINHNKRPDYFIIFCDNIQLGGRKRTIL